jgi:hypothetical protein
MRSEVSMYSILKWFAPITFLAIILSTAINAPAQSHPAAAPSTGERQQPEDEATIRMKKDMAKKANTERHESLKRDTDHLLELAQGLKDQVDKSSENTLSLDVLKKAEEIEKLAHSVREKMKGY